MYWTTSSGIIELDITKKQAAIGSHSGDCDKDIKYLRTLPSIKAQLNKIKPEQLAAELAMYGAWDSLDLQDHEQNLDRVLWIACGDIMDGNI